MIAEVLLIKDETCWSIWRTDPEVVALMQKYGVNLGTAQKYFDVYPSN